MKLEIRHETRYEYSHSVAYTIQVLRLTPRLCSSQRVLEWKMQAPGNLRAQYDAFGNATHIMVVNEPHQSIDITVYGVVEVSPHEGQANDQVDIPLESFLTPTLLTQSDAQIREFAYGSLPNGLSRIDDALRLASAVEARVVYSSGVTEVTSTAQQALQLGRGVCQDHAHLFIACCRTLGIAARYVSGYIDPGNSAHAASHAWADVWLANQGWVSVDITNVQLTGGQHCRLAVGRDYDSASPVRGLRTGGGIEAMHAQVSVKAALNQ